MPREHGTRTMYVNEKCRCKPCTRANNDYYHKRKRWSGEFPYEEEPFVNADEARSAVARMRCMGYGSRSIAAMSGVSRTTVTKIMRGERMEIRHETAQALIGSLKKATKPQPNSRVRADETLREVDYLLSVGYTKARIATEVLGNSTPALQIGKDGHVLARTAELISSRAEYERDQRAPLRVRVMDLLETFDWRWFTYRDIAEELGVTLASVQRLMAPERRPEWVIVNDDEKAIKVRFKEDE